MRRTLIVLVVAVLVSAGCEAEQCGPSKTKHVSEKTTAVETPAARELRYAREEAAKWEALFHDEHRARVIAEGEVQVLRRETGRTKPMTPVIAEDDPGWDCQTMGNQECGPGVEPGPKTP